MAEVLKTMELNTGTGGRYSIVECDGKHYCIDTSFTFDCGPETMVFDCDRDGDVSDWGELFTHHSYLMSDEYDFHKKMILAVLYYRDDESIFEIWRDLDDDDSRLSKHS